MTSERQILSCSLHKTANFSEWKEIWLMLREHSYWDQDKFVQLDWVLTRLVSMISECIGRAWNMEAWRMIWGSMAKRSHGEMTFIDGTKDASWCTEILADKMTLGSQTLFRRLFQYGHDLKHRANITQVFLKKTKVTTMAKYAAPDMSPIKTLGDIWGALSFGVHVMLYRVSSVGAIWR